jgi:hypothetical protein
MKNPTLFLLLVSCFPAILIQAEEPVIKIEDLLKPHVVLSDFSVTAPPSIGQTVSPEGKVDLNGELKDRACTVILKPESGHWDISKFSYFRVDITNNGDGLVWIRGRLDNDGALDWQNSSSSMAYILPGERATLGFPFQRAESADDSPEIFFPQGARPNGFRYHWMKFDPEKVIACRLIIQSASSWLDLKDIQVSLAQPFGAEANAKLLELPYLDKFGQVRQLEWPNKLHSEKELAGRTRKEASEIGTNNGPESFNRYGGWKNGPQLEATGFFRVEKYKGRWWFVDPEGRLFFSHGANSVGFVQSTVLKGRESLFDWIPLEKDFGEALDKDNVNFAIANLIRTYGTDWKAKGCDRIHTRMRQWGLNTVGAWSDPYLYKNPKTPYTPILHVWPGKKPLGKKVPDPFSEEFEQRVEDGLRELAKTSGSDPWCLGVFIDNELGWYEDFVHNALAGQPDMPARVAAIALLKEKYASIEALNAAWSTQHASWDAINGAPDYVEAPEEGDKVDEAEAANGDPEKYKAYREDRKAIERMIANRYYQVCQKMIRKIFPNHLYLGSRIHKATPEIYEEATRYSDVLSVNRYMALAATGLPKGFDKPALIAEFHFGAPDRGVPGVGLTFVGDQLQRSRAYAAYVLDAVLQPNIVGTHWFAYPDQSATSRPTVGKPGENYQIGFVDVTDSPYPEFTTYSRGLADVMYPLAETESVNLLQQLQDTWSDRQGSPATPQ